MERIVSQIFGTRGWLVRYLEQLAVNRIMGANIVIKRGFANLSHSLIMIELFYFHIPGLLGLN
jgi:hypothetical protein